MVLYVSGKPKIHHWGAASLEFNFEHCRGRMGWFCLCHDRPGMVTFYCQCGQESEAMEMKQIISGATMAFIGQTPQVIKENGGIAITMMPFNNLHTVEVVEILKP